jgi:hypothetical protein
MRLHSLSLATLFATSLFAVSAHAHDPSLHAPPPVAKAKPATCAELADTQRYSADLADAELKTKCEAEAKKAEQTKTEKKD